MAYAAALLAQVTVPAGFWRDKGVRFSNIEMMHMIRKGQLNGPKGQPASAAAQFYSLAF